MTISQVKMAEGHTRRESTVVILGANKVIFQPCTETPVSSRAVVASSPCRPAPPIFSVCNIEKRGIGSGNEARLLLLALKCGLAMHSCSY